MTRQDERARDIHALDADGMLLCNPRDREAAHRADVADIATADPAHVTCEKCISRLRARSASSEP